MSRASTIRRGAPKRGAYSRKKPKTSQIDRLLASLPVSEATLRKGFTWAMLGAGGAAAIAIVTALGVPGAVGMALAEGVGRAGFRVEQVEVTGLNRMDRMSVYAVALDQKSRAMPLVDLEAVRQNLLRYGWIADAHVSRRLPDTLLVHVEERKPTAVWQDQGKLALIAQGGVYLEPVRADALPNLPLVIGPHANEQEAAYQALIACAPQLKPLVKAATWVGNRRWNLLFASGETLALPEGEGEAGKALMWFAERDDANPLLGKGFVRFDMRDPSKFVARKGEVQAGGADTNVVNRAEPAQSSSNNQISA